MNHYTVRAIKGKRCVRRVDSWTIVNARNIYERLLSEFPGALVQIYGPGASLRPFTSFANSFGTIYQEVEIHESGAFKES